MRLLFQNDPWSSGWIYGVYEEVRGERSYYLHGTLDGKGEGGFFADLKEIVEKEMKREAKSDVGRDR